MERRQFIQVTLAGAIGIGLPGLAWEQAAASHISALAHPDLLILLNSSERVSDIGIAYRALPHSEKTADALASAILADTDLSPNLPERTLREGLARRIRRDFAERRTVQLDGWILSLTEARQCALYSILSSTHP